MNPKSTEAGRVADAPSAFKHLAPSVLYVAHIFWSGSSKDTGMPLQVSDKVAHATAFGLMVPVLLLAVTYFRPNGSLSMRIAAATLASSVVGGLLEVWQYFLPWRSADVFDWLADTAGALAVGFAILGLAAVVRRSAPTDA